MEVPQGRTVAGGQAGLPELENMEAGVCMSSTRQTAAYTAWSA
jgi:hypothetical protein